MFGTLMLTCPKERKIGACRVDPESGDDLEAVVAMMLCTRYLDGTGSQKRQIKRSYERVKKASAEEEWRYLGFFVHGNHRGQAGEDSVALGGDAGVVDVVQVVVGD